MNQPPVQPDLAVAHATAPACRGRRQTELLVAYTEPLRIVIEPRPEDPPGLALQPALHAVLDLLCIDVARQAELEQARVLIEAQAARRRADRDPDRLAERGRFGAIDPVDIGQRTAFGAALPFREFVDDPLLLVRDRGF